MSVPQLFFMLHGANASIFSPLDDFHAIFAGAEQLRVEFKSEAREGAERGGVHQALQPRQLLGAERDPVSPVSQGARRGHDPLHQDRQGNVRGH